MGFLEIVVGMVLALARAARRTQDRFEYLPVTGTVGPTRGRWSHRGWRALVAVGRAEWWLAVASLAVLLGVGAYLLP